MGWATWTTLVTSFACARLLHTPKYCWSIHKTSVSNEKTTKSSPVGGGTWTTPVSSSVCARLLQTYIYCDQIQKIHVFNKKP